MTNTNLLLVIGKTPTINIRQDADGYYVDLLVDRADTDIIKRYGAHPTDTASAEYKARQMALVGCVTALIAVDPEAYEDAMGELGWQGRPAPAAVSA